MTFATIVWMFHTLPQHQCVQRIHSLYPQCVDSSSIKHRLATFSMLAHIHGDSLPGQRPHADTWTIKENTSWTPVARQTKIEQTTLKYASHIAQWDRAVWGARLPPGYLKNVLLKVQSIHRSTEWNAVKIRIAYSKTQHYYLSALWGGHGQYIWVKSKSCQLLSLKPETINHKHLKNKQN